MSSSFNLPCTACMTCIRGTNVCAVCSSTALTQTQPFRGRCWISTLPDHYYGSGLSGLDKSAANQHDSAPGSLNSTAVAAHGYHMNIWRTFTRKIRRDGGIQPRTRNGSVLRLPRVYCSYAYAQTEAHASRMGTSARRRAPREPGTPREARMSPVLSPGYSEAKLRISPQGYIR